MPWLTAKREGTGTIFFIMPLFLYKLTPLITTPAIAYTPISMYRLVDACPNTSLSSILLLALGVSLLWADSIDTWHG
jgi:hypothetical protein